MNESDILRAAADLLEPDGAWIQGAFSNVTGGHCVAGAVALSGGCNGPIITAALLALGEYVGSFSVPRWNDHGSRNQQEVVDTLRTVAKQLEEIRAY